MRDSDGKFALCHIVKSGSGDLITLFLKVCWEEHIANQFAEVLSEMKEFVWSFHSDGTLASDWWISVGTEASRKLKKLPSSRDRLLASVIPCIGLAMESAGDLFLGIRLRRDSEEAREDGSAFVVVLMAFLSLFAQGFFCCFPKSIANVSFLVAFVAVLTDMAAAAYLMATGNRFTNETVLAILLPLALPLFEIGLTTTCKRDHLVTPILFAQCILSPLIIVLYAFICYVKNAYRGNETNVSSQ